MAVMLASFLIVGSVCYTSYLHFASSHANELYVYNWGEYIDEDVIDGLRRRLELRSSMICLRRMKRCIRSSKRVA